MTSHSLEKAAKITSFDSSSYLSLIAWKSETSLLFRLVSGNTAITQEQRLVVFREIYWWK